MVVERSAKLHPALYYKGLLDACRRRDITICAKAAVKTIAPSRQRLAHRDHPRRHRGGRCRDRHQRLYRRDATPELRRRVCRSPATSSRPRNCRPTSPRTLIPKGRTLADTKRVLCYYRMSPDGKRMVFGGRARFTPVTPAVSAPILHRFMTDRFPQLRGIRVTHAWTGNVAFTLDALPHMGQRDGMHYCLGCNGSGVAMMTYLGYQTARKIARVANAACAFDREDFPDHPLYSGNPWFLPLVGGYFRLRDRLDRLLA